MPHKPDDLRRGGFTDRLTDKWIHRQTSRWSHKSPLIFFKIREIGWKGDQTMELIKTVTSKLLSRKLVSY
jgi:hypothetical protein